MNAFQLIQQYGPLHAEADYLFDQLAGRALSGSNPIELKPEHVAQALRVRFPEPSAATVAAVAAKQFYLGAYRVVQAAATHYINYPESVGVKRNRQGLVDSLALLESGIFDFWRGLLGCAGLTTILDACVEATAPVTGAELTKALARCCQPHALTSDKAHGRTQQALVKLLAQGRIYRENMFGEENRFCYIGPCPGTSRRDALMYAKDLAKRRYKPDVIAAQVAQRFPLMKQPYIDAVVASVWVDVVDIANDFGLGPLVLNVTSRVEAA